MNLILKKSWMDGISRTSNATTTPPLWFKVLSIPSPQTTTTEVMHTTSILYPYRVRI